MLHWYQQAAEAHSVTLKIVLKNEYFQNSHQVSMSPPMTANHMQSNLSVQTELSGH